MTLTQQDLDQIRGIVTEVVISAVDSSQSQIIEVIHALAAHTDEQIQQMCDEISVIKSDLQAVWIVIGEIRTELADVQVQLGQLRVQVGKLEDRFDRLSKRSDEDVTAAYKDIIQLRKRVFTLEAEYKAVRKDLQELKDRK